MIDVFPDGGRRLLGRAGVGLAVATTLLSGTVFAGSASAEHVECGAKITEDTKLDSDIDCTGKGTGLVIAADNVTLDLGGHTVTGDPQARAENHADSAGILFPMRRGSTVHNGTVEQFDAGVAIRGGSGNAVRDLIARDNINYRVVTGVDAAPLPLTPPCDYGDGIAVFNSEDNVVEHNTVVNNGPLSGISLVESSDANRVSGNVVADNDVLNRTPLGLATVCGTGAGQGPMSQGRAVQDIGIRVEGPGADHNRVQRNQVTANGLTGIAIHGYVCDPPESPLMPPMPPAPNNGGNLVLHNDVSGTGQDTSDLDATADGIATLQQGPAGTVCVAHSNTIKDNVSSDNFRDGIFMGGRGSHDNRVINNVVNDNARDGLHLEGPQGDTPGAVDNRLLGNAGSGNDRWDGADFNDDCDNNKWRGSSFDKVNRECVRGAAQAKGRR